MRVTLGRLAAGDTPAISMAMMDPKVSGWMNTFPFPHGGESPRDDRIITSGPSDYAIRVDGRLAGLVIAAPELGCWIDPRYQGSGVATRGAMLALTRLFMSGSRVAYARFLPDNPQMKAMLDRLGFVPDASIDSSALRPDLGLLTLSIEDFAIAQPFDIVSPRLRMTGVSPGDLTELYDIASRRDVMQNLTFFAQGMPAEAFAEVLCPFVGVPPFWSTIRLDGRIIGTIGLESRTASDLDPQPGRNRLLLQIMLEPAAWGLGLGTEAVQAFTKEIHDRFGLNMIEAEIFADDGAALAVAASCGFVAGGEPFTLISPSRSAPGRHFSLIF